uniref:Pco144871 n=1 Tax=Arundo donax TaxID=35708 RepID=A0A0A9DKX7_ARUDO
MIITSEAAQYSILSRENIVSNGSRSRQYLQYNCFLDHKNIPLISKIMLTCSNLARSKKNLVVGAHLVQLHGVDSAWQNQ